MNLRNKDRKGYKHTSVGWIPEDWEEVNLKAISQIYFSGVDKKSFDLEKSVFLCNYMDVYKNDYIRNDIQFMQATASDSEIQKFKLRKGDILITKDSETPDDIGVPSIVMEDLENVICGYHLAMIRPKLNEIDSVFLGKAIASKYVSNQFTSLANGATRFGLSTSAVENAKIPLPPLAEQKKIAEILSKWDKAIEQTQKLIGSKEKLKKGLMQKLLTGRVRVPEFGKGLNHGTHRKTLNEKGGMPEGWEEKRLGDVSVIQGEYGINASAVSYSEKLPTYLRITDIDAEGNFISETKKSVKNRESSKYYLKEGDIVFARTGATVGKTYLYNTNDGELVFAGFLIRFRLDKKKSVPYYIKLYTQTKQYLDWVVATSARSGQPGINSIEYCSLKIPLPPLPEQKKIADVLSKLDEQISFLRKKESALKEQKKGLMQKLLTGEVRV